MEPLHKEHLLYVKVKNELLRKIAEGEYKPGNMIPTENEIADIHKVSRITVRKALSILNKDGILTRISGRGTFINESIGLPSQTENSTTEKVEHNNSVILGENKIGVILPGLNDSNSIRILSGINKGAKSQGYNTIISCSDDIQSTETNLINEFLNSGVKGLIIFPADNKIYNDTIIELKFKNIPFVLIDRYYPNIETDFVVSDNYNGAIQATQYLINLGHKNIAFVSTYYLNVSSISDRLKGYEDTLLKNHIPFSHSNLHLYNSLKLNELEFRENFYNFVKSNPDITAFFSLDDNLAFNVINSLLSYGFKIPNDYSVVGFDNLDISEHFKIPLTTVNQDGIGVGEKAAEILIDKIQGASEGLNQIYIPTYFVERNSCRPLNPL